MWFLHQHEHAISHLQLTTAACRTGALAYVGAALISFAECHKVAPATSSLRRFTVSARSLWHKFPPRFDVFLSK